MLRPLKVRSMPPNRKHYGVKPASGRQVHSATISCGSRFGKFKSNGDFFFTSRSGDKLNFTVVNLSEAVYEDTVLYELSPSLYGLSFNGNPDAPGVGKARYWRDKIILK